jgi:uncharacterized membrane protein
VPLKRARALNGYVLAVALVGAGIVHIAATLLVPLLATGGAVQRLLADLPPNKMLVLPPVTAESQPLPFMSPDTRVAVCRYDVSGGPVTISALLPDKGWSLGLYTPEGGTFYVVPAQDLRRAEVKFTLVPHGEEPSVGFLGSSRTSVAEPSQIRVPHHEGLVIVRASLRGLAYKTELEAQLARATCGLQRTTPPGDRTASDSGTPSQPRR